MPLQNTGGRCCRCCGSCSFRGVPFEPRLAPLFSLHCPRHVRRLCLQRSAHAVQARRRRCQGGRQREGSRSSEHSSEQASSSSREQQQPHAPPPCSHRHALCTVMGGRWQAWVNTQKKTFTVRSNSSSTQAEDQRTVRLVCGGSRRMCTCMCVCVAAARNGSTIVSCNAAAATEG